MLINLELFDGLYLNYKGSWEQPLIPFAPQVYGSLIFNEVGGGNTIPLNSKYVYLNDLYKRR